MRLCRSSKSLSCAPEDLLAESTQPTSPQEGMLMDIMKTPKLICSMFSFCRALLALSRR